MNRFVIPLLLPTVLASIIRFPLIGQLPPGEHFFLRLLTALCGVISVFTLSLLVKILSKDARLAFFVGLALALMPWHIEQSRVYSPSLLGVTVFIVSILIAQFFKSTKSKVITTTLGFTCAMVVFNTFWIFHDPSWNWSLVKYLENIFKLISFELLFFKNDSFWWGGLRTWGMMLPSMIPLFLTGLAVFIHSRLEWKKITVIFSLVIILVAAANPGFPEVREFFWISPMLGLILGLGALKFYQIFTKSSVVVRSLFILYLLFVSYEYILLFHFYVAHYPRRILSEVSREKIDF